ncbi:MAG TPA: hypothetical protein VK665_02045 [Candidatus Elarobacter sp.]|nr:hypothetical protein [Candidatus Elarobacter sp.]
MSLLKRTLAFVAIVAAAVLGDGGFAALAQSTQSAARTTGGPRTTTTAPTPPPLPYGDQSRTAQGEKRSLSTDRSMDVMTAFARLPQSMKMGDSKLTPYSGPRPPIPKMTDLLHHKARWKQSASGGTIVLTGTSNTPYLDDQTLAYGSNVFWLCQNLTASTTYRYVLFPPDGTAYLVSPKDYVNGGNKATFTTDTQGRCMQTGGGGSQVPWYAQLSLQTPLTASPDPINQLFAGSTRTGTTDVPYSGVWTIAVQNTATSLYEAVAYSVVLGTLNFNTYSDPVFSTAAIDFTSGSTVYVKASGLNPAHFYSFGFVNTSGNGLPCVFAIPAGAQNFNNATCFTAGAIGVLPTSQAFSGQYTTPSSGANAAGTQTVQLYDATSNDLISTQQISVNPSSIVWNALLPFNGATNGTNLNDTFATDGILGAPGGTGLVQEQSVQGLTYQASGVISGHVYRMTISNGNGVVLSGSTTDTTPAFGAPQAFALPTQFTAASTSTGAQKILFPINTANFTSFGATQTPFAPNVYTAQIYDVTAGAVVGSKSFHVVSYDANLLWTNPAGAYVNAAAAGLPTNVTTTLRNDADTLYGTWNADGVKQITINNDSGNKVNLGLQAGVTTTTDSQGQTWNLTNPNAQTVIATPAVAGQFLAPGSTIPIPLTVATASGNCTTACVLRPQILPVHGVVASTTNATMSNTAANGLNVYGNGVLGSNTQASYSWSVGAYSVPATLGTPRYKQMMYRLGTDNAASGGYYTVTITVTNNGAPAAMSDLEFTMPSTVDPNVITPTVVSATVNGANQTANWGTRTLAGGNGAVSDPTLGPNAWALYTTNNGATLPVGKVATFVIKMPIMQTAFPFQQIPALANYDATSYAVGATNVQTNAIAGTQNIDSTELGVFSLNPALMYTNITPAVVPALANSTFQFEFDNVSSGLDPNPDYVSQMLITVPSAGGVYPAITSVTASNGATFNANATGTAGQWLLDLCAVSTVPVVNGQTSTPCAAAVDANSLPPGGKLFVNFKYASAPVVGNYTVNWLVVGANGGAVVGPTTGTPLTIANTTAQTSFTYAGGYTASPVYPPVSPIQSVTSGSQPVIGSWSNYTEGNGYVFELHNNGSTTITDVSVAIPWANTSGQLFDTTYPWSVDQTSVYVYGAGASGAKCSGNGINSLTQAVNGSPGTSGLLRLSGCNLAVGQNLDIFFYARNPYDVNSTFRFDASVATGNTTPPDPRTAGNPNTLPIYSLSNTVRIITDARLAIQIPNGAGAYAPALNTAVPALSCPGCTYNSAGALPLINLNQITGTANYVDALAASVYTDSQNGWNLSVSADVNPSTSSGQLSTWLTPESASPGGTYTKSVTAATLVPTASTLALSNWTGTNPVPKKPVDNMMGYRVTVNPLSVNNNATTTVTLTYTLIAN